MIEILPIGLRNTSECFDVRIVLDNAATGPGSQSCAVITGNYVAATTTLPRIIAGRENPEVVEPEPLRQSGLK